MTAEEEMAARARLVTDYAHAKQRLVLLENEARRTGQALRAFGDSLAMYPHETSIPPDVEAILEGPDKLRSCARRK